MKIKRLLLLLALPLLVASCTSYKNVPYLQNPEAVNDFEETLPLYDAKIMPKDMLSITVNTTDPKAATPFNLTVQTPINAALTNISTTTQPTMQQYLVNNKGEIDFPVIGRLEVGGLTKNEAEDLIRERLKPYLKESPIVTVRMSNYKLLISLRFKSNTTLVSHRNFSLPSPSIFTEFNVISIPLFVTLPAFALAVWKPVGYGTERSINISVVLPAYTSTAPPKRPANTL